MSVVRRWKQRLGRIGILGVGTVVGLVFCELTLRLVFHLGLLPESNLWVQLVTSVREEQAQADDSSRQLFRRSENRGLAWEPIPGFARQHIRINSAGFRGPEVEPRKADGVTRLVVLGDSETFGMRLAEHDTFPGVLEAALEQAYAERDFEVLNFGVPGYSTAQEKAMLEDRALAFQPDGVVLYYVANDPEQRNLTLLMSDSARLHSYLLLLWKAFRMAEADADLPGNVFAHDQVEYFQLLHSPEYFAPTQRLLRQIDDILSARGIPFVLVISPTLSGFDDFRRYPYGAIHEQLRELASPTLHVLDPLPAVAAAFRHPKELWITPTDPHKNRRANEVIAAALARPVGEVLGLEPTRQAPTTSP